MRNSLLQLLIVFGFLLGLTSCITARCPTNSHVNEEGRCITNLPCIQGDEELGCPDDDNECTEAFCNEDIGCDSRNAPQDTPCAGGAGHCNANGVCIVQCVFGSDCFDIDSNLCTLESCKKNCSNDADCVALGATQCVDGECQFCDGEECVVRGRCSSTINTECGSVEKACPGEAESCDEADKICPEIGPFCDPEDGLCDSLPIVPGDCNRNGEVTLSDALCILQCIGESLTDPSPTFDCLCSADCNCDGEINVTDVLCTQRISVGLEVETQCP